MNAILEQINSAGKIFVEFALPMLVQSSVLILILLLIDFALRKKVRAVFRYGIWLLVLIKLVLPTSLSAPLSLGYFLGDGLAYVDISRTTTEAETMEPTQAIVSPIIDPPRIEAGRDTSAVAPTTPGAEPAIAEPVSSPVVSITPITWQGVVFLAWLTVVMAMGLLLLQRAFFVRGLVAQAKDANGFMADTLESCRGSMGVKRKIGLKVSANTTSPAVCGLFRPVILVPQNLASSLSKSQLRAVLLHELAHIKRGDLWVNLAQTVLQIIYFYNPLLWLANCIIRRVREQAVDEMVLVAMGEAARQYPQTLVNVAKLAFKRPALSLRLIGVVESKSALAGRIKHILNRPMPKKAKLGILGLAVVIITAAILLPMATSKPGPPSLVIKGTVKDAQTGEPIAGARVFDDGYGPEPNWEQIKADERSEWGAITNSAGEYSFLTWPEHHSIKVQAPGYKAERRSLYDGHFVFNKKDEEIFDFALEPEKILESSVFKKTLPNGVTVELVGICEHPSEGKQWWRPDGSLVEVRPYLHLGYSMSSVSQKVLEAAFKTNMSDDEIGFTINERESGGLVHPLDDNPIEDIWAGCVRFDKDAERGSFLLGVATGRWAIISRSPAEGSSGQSSSEGDFTWGQFHQENESAVIPVTHNIRKQQQDYRVVAIDTSGNTHTSWGKFYGGSNDWTVTTSKFRNLTVEKIKEFQFQTRPYQWFEFRNVSLRPGQKTDVQIDGGKADDKAQIENAIRQLWTAIEANDIEKVAKLGPQGTFAYDNFDITNWILKQAEEKKRILTERSRDLAEPDDIWIRGDEAIALKKMTRWYQEHVYLFVKLPDGWTLYTMDTRHIAPTVSRDYLFRAWRRTNLDNKAWVEYFQAADLLHKGANRAELARRFSSIGWRYAITRKGRICIELGILLARMVEKDKSFTEPVDLQSLPTDEQINYYIFKLRDVAEQEMSVPGKCRVLFYPKTPNSPAVALRNMGRAVIPAMISLLDDHRPTRSVGVPGNGGVVLRYCDVALEIIEAISGQKFDKRTKRGAFLSTADETTRSGIISRAKARWHHKNDVQVEEESLSDFQVSDESKKFGAVDFEGYFVNSAAGGLTLEQLWDDKNKDLRDADEILEIIRKGLRRYSGSGNILRWIGNLFIWGKNPQNEKAIELMYHASGSPSRGLYGDAIYFGLSVTKTKTPEILQAMVAVAMKTDDYYNVTGRILWGCRDQKDELIACLDPYLNSDDISIRQKAQNVKNYFMDSKAFMAKRAKEHEESVQQEYGNKLGQLKDKLLKGDSQTRLDTLKQLRNKGIMSIVDVSFLDAFQACTKDSNPEVRTTAARMMGGKFIWSGKLQNTQAIEILAELLEDPDRSTRGAAVYYGLSTVRNPNKELVRKMLATILDDREINYYGRVIWGIRRNKQACVEILKEWMNQSEQDNQRAVKAYEIYEDVSAQQLPDEYAQRFAGQKSNAHEGLVAMCFQAKPLSKEKLQKQFLEHLANGSLMQKVLDFYIIETRETAIGMFTCDNLADRNAIRDALTKDKVFQVAGYMHGKIGPTGSGWVDSLQKFRKRNELNRVSLPKPAVQVEEVEPDSEYMFGPVIDCVVHAVDAEKDSFIDLDTGKAFSSEKIGTKDREELFRAKGIDISILIITSALKWIDGDILLGCYDMIAVGLKKKEWETITPIEVTQKIETGQRVPNRGLPVKSIAGALSPSVYAIGTREGSMGIIQIIGFADDPKCVKIRYKMVKKAPGRKTNLQVED
ncbi:MAG: HEAT repeat domain-containing protein [Planctomycetes bacterium]|nr:HEAT repeat domain-containing protein [Planctomycetota bacterium]